MRAINHQLTLALFLSLFFSVSMARQSNSGPTKSGGEEEKSFVQFVLVGMESREDAVSIDRFLRTQAGVLLSRADYHTGVYFGLANPDAMLDRAHYQGWLQSLGFDLKCFETGIVGRDSFRRLSVGRCQE